MFKYICVDIWAFGQRSSEIEDRLSVQYFSSGWSMVHDHLITLRFAGREEWRKKPIYVCLTLNQQEWKQSDDDFFNNLVQDKIIKDWSHFGIEPESMILTHTELNYLMQIVQNRQTIANDDSSGTFLHNELLEKLIRLVQISESNTILVTEQLS